MQDFLKSQGQPTPVIVPQRFVQRKREGKGGDRKRLIRLLLFSQAKTQFQTLRKLGSTDGRFKELRAAMKG